MRKASEASYSSYDFEEDDCERASAASPSKPAGRRVLKRIVAGVFLAMGGVVVYNAVSLQDRRHPAPLFGKTATVAVIDQAQDASAPQAAQNPPSPLSAPAAPAPMRQPLAQTAPARVASRPIDPIATQAVKTQDNDAIESELRKTHAREPNAAVKSSSEKPPSALKSKQASALPAPANRTHAPLKPKSAEAKPHLGFARKNLATAAPPKQHVDSQALRALAHAATAQPAKKPQNARAKLLTAKPKVEGGAAAARAEKPTAPSKRPDAIAGLLKSG